MSTNTDTSPSPSPSPSTRRRNRLINAGLALALALLSFVAVLKSQHRQGIARDEAQYFGFGARYARYWVDLFRGVPGLRTAAAITATWGGRAPTDNNREHPPLMKTLFGLSELAFHQKLHWTDAVTANRLPTIALNALLVALVFLFTTGIWGRAAGVTAGLLTLLLPRAFFHAGLACFDAPIAALWFATTVAYHRALRGGVLAALLCGVCFGLALATKHNAFLLPIGLGLHYLWVALRPELLHQRARRAAQAAAGPGVPALARELHPAARFALAPLTFRPAILVALAVVGPLILIILWPWLWFDTEAHLRDWLRFHLTHVHYNFEYLGHNWNHPRFPWHVALLTTLLTVPVATLAAAATGLGVVLRRAIRRVTDDPARAPALLCVLSIAVAAGPFFLGSTPIFGAEKHWAPAIPFLCVFAGVGLTAAARAAIARGAALLPRAAFLRHRRAPTAAIALLATLAVTAAATETFHAQPYALSSYNALAGGAPGGADLGMNRQFWGVSARGVLPWLDAHAPPGARVYTHDANIPWGYYMNQGLLRRDLPDAGHEEGGVASSDLALVIHELHFNRHDYMIWRNYGTVRPVHVLTFDGVPLVSVYQRPRP